MRQINLFILLLLFSLTWGQKKKTLPAPNNLLNGFINKSYKPKSLSSNIKNFPFNKASKVKLISYNLDFKKEPYDLPPSPKDSVAIKNYKNRKKTVTLADIIADKDLTGIQQQKSLNLIEIQQLTHILYNACGKYLIGLSSSGGCYFPRNALLFYDENDKIFAYFEICFQCSRYESEPKGLFEDLFYCEDMYSLLNKFFNSTGIETQYREEK